MLLEKLALKNILSFRDTTVELGPLNVLIGPNGAGKTNLIEAISLLQAAPTGLSREILRGGGVRQWLWLGDRASSPIGSLECQVRPPGARQVGALTYRLEFSESANGFVVLAESLAKSGVETSSKSPGVYFVRTFDNVEFVPLVRDLAPSDPQVLAVPSGESVLSRFKILFDTIRHHAHYELRRSFWPDPGF